MTRRCRVIEVEPLTEAVRSMLATFLSTKITSWGSFAWQPTCCHCPAPAWSVVPVVDKRGRVGCFTFCSDHANEVKAEMKRALGLPRQMGASDAVVKRKSAGSKRKKAAAT